MGANPIGNALSGAAAIAKGSVQSEVIEGTPLLRNPDFLNALAGDKFRTFDKDSNFITRLRGQAGLSKEEFGQAAQQYGARNQAEIDAAFNFFDDTPTTKWQGGQPVLETQDGQVTQQEARQGVAAVSAWAEQKRMLNR